MPQTHKQRAGQAGESAALQYLQAAGLKLIARNYHCRWGEIDLVMQEKNCLVFVEVRFRSSSDYGGAAASVNASKQAKLQKTALHYLQSKASSRQVARIDVIALKPDPQGFHCDWIKNAIQS